MTHEHTPQPGFDDPWWRYPQLQNVLIVNSRQDYSRRESTWFNVRLSAC